MLRKRRNTRRAEKQSEAEKRLHFIHFHFDLDFLLDFSLQFLHCDSEIVVDWDFLAKNLETNGQSIGSRRVRILTPALVSSCR